MQFVLNKHADSLGVERRYVNDSELIVLSSFSQVYKTDISPRNITGIAIRDSAMTQGCSWKVALSGK